MEPDLVEIPTDCPFCAIVAHRVPCYLVFEDGQTLAFLDHRPLVPGHCLLVPRMHYPTLLDVPRALVAALFVNAQRLARAVESGLGAEGSFLAINTKVSQSVSHLHIHVMPRWRKDGLFSRRMIWQRRPYADEETVRAIQSKIQRALSDGLEDVAPPPVG